jgi:hypothetical protein
MQPNEVALLNFLRKRKLRGSLNATQAVQLDALEKRAPPSDAVRILKAIVLCWC